MKILVTGSKGFLGKRLCFQLSKRKHFVRWFDLPRDDILKKEDCEKATKGIDVVIHLAAVLDEENKLLNSVNIQGTENILEASVKNKVKRFIHLSTIGVHGKVKGIVNEESKFNPETAYEKSKLKAEEIVDSYQELIPCTVLRPGLIVGPNQYWKKIIKIVKKKFPLPGNGANKWQIVHVDDVVQAILLVLKKEESEGETYIVAEEKASTLKELILTVRKTLGMNEKIKTIPFFVVLIGSFFYKIFLKLTGKTSLITPNYLQRLVRNREYDISKIKALGFKPKYDMKKAITETIKFLEQRTTKKTN